MTVWLILAIGGMLGCALAWRKVAADAETTSGRARRLGNSLDQLFSFIQDAENGQRGLLLTSDEDLPERAASQNMRKHFRSANRRSSLRNFRC
jgi:CHASE3 domain sensor protein